MLNPIAARLDQFMNLLAVRQRITGANIANADTPGYKTKDIDFESELSRAMDGQTPRPIELDTLPVKNDGNNVSLDREARQLAENAMRFTVASQFLHSEIRATRAALQEGR